jgi:hypothetical protein
MYPQHNNKKNKKDLRDHLVFSSQFTEEKTEFQKDWIQF